MIGLRRVFIDRKGYTISFVCLGCYFLFIRTEGNKIKAELSKMLFLNMFQIVDLIYTHRSQVVILAESCDAFLFSISTLCVHSSKRLVTLARGLSPAFLRFGGKRTDFLQFNNQKNLAKFRGPGPDYYLKNYEDGD